MNRIGRKKTVLLSLVITFASLLLPVFGDGYVPVSYTHLDVYKRQIYRTIECIVGLTFY